MKKNMLMLAALAVFTIPFVFTSCGKNSPDPDTEIILPDPPTRDAAMMITFPESDAPKYQENGNEYTIKSLELTEANRYILHRELIKSKAGGMLEIIIGKFTGMKGNYNCIGLGKITVNGSKVIIEFSSGGTFNGSGNVKDSTKPSGTDQNNFIRNWKISDVELTVDGNGVEFSHGFTGCNLYEIATFAKGKGVNIDPSKFANASIEFSFTSNVFAIRLSDKEAIEGTYQVGLGTITLTVNNGNEFFNGTIKGTYKFAAGNKVNLVLSSSIKGYNGKMEFNMVQVD
jgi:hypothetical protein